LVFVVVVVSFVYVLEFEVLVGGVEVRKRSVVMWVLMSRGQVPPLVTLSR
jgi:hypothetical protein